MKKAIVITANKRPLYLERMLDSLDKNDLTDWALYGFCEPYSFDCVKTLVTFGLRNKFQKFGIKENNYKLGVRLNPFVGLYNAFENENCDYVLYLEDDIVISPDATKFADYSAQTLALCGVLFNYNSKDANAPAEQYRYTKNFSALGLVITKEMWNEVFKPQWFNDDHHLKGKIGWDWSIIAFLEKNDYYTIQPLLSRSNHIGREGGTHCDAETHDRLFGDIKHYLRSTDLRYKIARKQYENLSDRHWPQWDGVLC